MAASSSSSFPWSCEDLQVHAFPGVGAEVFGLNLSVVESKDDDADADDDKEFALASKTTSSSRGGSDDDGGGGDECRSKIISLWNQHSVLLIRNQHNLSESSLYQFALALGRPRPAGSRGYYMRAGHPHGSGRSSDIPHVSVMSNMDADTGKPMAVTKGHGSQSVDWHQDDSYTNTPAQGALLYNTIHPVPDPYPSGNTSFCNLYAAYEALPEETQTLIEQLHLVHDISRNSAGHVRPGLTLPETYQDVVGPAHPLVIVHPVTKRKALHLGRNQPAPSSYILERPGQDGHDLFDYLWRHATSPEFVWTHTSWRPGDLLIWDNLSTMHARSAVDSSQEREMLRVLLRGPEDGLHGLPIVVHNDKNSNNTRETRIMKTIPTTANDKADSEARTKDNLTSTTQTTHDKRSSSMDVPATVEENTPVLPLTTTTDSPDTIESTISRMGVMNDTCSLNRTSAIDGAKSETTFGSPFVTAAISVASLLIFVASSWRKSSSMPAERKTGHSTSLDRDSGVVSEQVKSPDDSYYTEARVHVFWVFFLWIYLFFQSFSCGRADRLWRISEIYDVSPPVLLKPYGISYLWYEALLTYMRLVENVVLCCMVALAIPPGRVLPIRVESTVRRVLAFVSGLGWLYLHGYEHSLTGGSHTHLMPAICMMALALPPRESLVVIRWWNMFLLFSAGLSKLFNGDHHTWWAWMDGQSLQFYFENSREAVPEPINTWTMEHDWLAASQAAKSVIFELSTCLLFWQPYRLYFPWLGALFHGMIWYTLGVNYLTSVVIQFTLVMDADDWKLFLAKFFGYKSQPATEKSEKEETVTTSSFSVAKVVAYIQPVILSFVILRQIEFWPLSNIPMYSGYRPRVGYNTTHIANRTYLDHLINECAPHVWSRHWTDIIIEDLETNERSKMLFCAPSPLFDQKRGVKELCLIPEPRLYDTERGSIRESRSFRLDPPLSSNRSTFKNTMRVGGWNRQKPIVIMAELPGKYHVYCQHDHLSPAEDWLHRNCAVLKTFPQLQNKTLRAELVVHLGTGDLTVGQVDCNGYNYPVDRVPSCVQSPFH